MKVFGFKVPRGLKAELDRLSNANPNITRSEAVRRAVWETIEYIKTHHRLPPILRDFYDGDGTVVTSVKIDEDLERELREVSARFGVSMAEIIRRAIIRYIEARNRKTAVYVGRYIKIRYGYI
jgi:metal-responsive CopG/Arc/MetJ family transcriptional regulator